jgi:hypothetical protein
MAGRNKGQVDACNRIDPCQGINYYGKFPASPAKRAKITADRHVSAHLRSCACQNFAESIR